MVGTKSTRGKEYKSQKQLMCSWFSVTKSYSLWDLSVKRRKDRRTDKAISTRLMIKNMYVGLYFNVRFIN